MHNRDPFLFHMVALLSLVLILASLVPVAIAGNHEHARENRANVSQRPPWAGPPDLSDNDDEPGEPGVHVHPNAGGARALNVSVTAEDENGHNDLAGLSVTIYQPDNSTIHIEPLAGTKASATGRQAVFEAQFEMQHYDEPGTYYVKTVITDRDGQTATTWSEFIFQEIAAVSIETESVSLNPGGDDQAPIMPGNDTRDNPTIITISNTGNVPINALLSGTDMTNEDESAALPVSSIVFSTDSGFDPEVALGEDPYELTLGLTRGQDSTGAIYFAVDIPTGLPQDVYRGTMTLSAVKAT
jgi:hypothetical protein